MIIEDQRSIEEKFMDMFRVLNQVEYDMESFLTELDSYNENKEAFDKHLCECSDELIDFDALNVIPMILVDMPKKEYLIHLIKHRVYKFLCNSDKLFTSQIKTIESIEEQGESDKLIIAHVGINRYCALQILKEIDKYFDGIELPSLKLSVYTQDSINERLIDEREKFRHIKTKHKSYVISQLLLDYLQPLNRPEKEVVFKWITGNSGADVFNNLTGGRIKVSEAQEIDKEINEIRLKLQ